MLVFVLLLLLLFSALAKLRRLAQPATLQEQEQRVLLLPQRGLLLEPHAEQRVLVREPRVEEDHLEQAVESLQVLHGQASAAFFCMRFLFRRDSP